MAFGETNFLLLIALVLAVGFVAWLVMDRFGEKEVKTNE